MEKDQRKENNINYSRQEKRKDRNRIKSVRMTSPESESDGDKSW